MTDDPQGIPNDEVDREIDLFRCDVTHLISDLTGKMKSCSFLMLVLACLFGPASPGIYQNLYEEAYEMAQSMTLDQLIGQTIQTDFYAIASKNHTDVEMVQKYHFGSLLVGGNGCPDQNGDMFIFGKQNDEEMAAVYATATEERWRKLAAKFQNTVEKVTTKSGKVYHISLLLATDAVHNNQHVAGTVLFPHNIGLSCSHNPKNFQNSGKWTGYNIKNSGFNYAFAPTVAVSHNPQWGRFYETMGQKEDMISKYAYSYTQGLQGLPDSLTGVLGSAKHYIGDGATMYGADEGNAHVGSFKTFIDHNSQGYIGSIKAEIGSVMCSYSAINWLPMALSPLFKTHLRDKLKFDGFVIGDYNEIVKIMSQQLPTDLQAVSGVDHVASLILNAGTDMMMIPSKKDVDNYVQGLKKAIQNSTVTYDRLLEAVARILSVKLALGIAKLDSPSPSNMSEGNNREENQEENEEKKQGNNREENKGNNQEENKGNNQEETSEYEDSLKAVHQSLVLVKNQKVLPLKMDDLKYIVLVGDRIINVDYKDRLFLSYDNIGLQCGGWTLRWQGFEGNQLWQGQNRHKSNASSILDALKRGASQFELVYPNYTTLRDRPRIDAERASYLELLKTYRRTMNAKNTLILATVGESPYAEMTGDVGIPYCQGNDRSGCLYFPNAYIFNNQRPNLGLDYSDFDKDVIAVIKEQDSQIPILSVLFAGRPMHMNSIVEQSSAVLHAFLPGTSGGQGVVDAIMGSYVLKPKGEKDTVNTLSFDWPYRSEQLQRFPVYSADGSVPRIEGPMFKVGHGLSTATA